MNTLCRLLTGFAVASALCVATPGSADTKLSLSNKWRIEFSEGANSDGVIHFVVTPEGGQPVDVMASIEDGRSENGVARDVRDAFVATLDKERFHVETDDGEDVLVKKKSRSPNFELRLAGSTVKSVRIDVEKE